MSGQLRVAVIGAQTRHENSPRVHTVYRTAVNYRGACFHRLIRYRQFLSFAESLKLAKDEEPIRVKLPPRIWWSRKASLKRETVEARQVMLSEFMQEVCKRRLSPKSEEKLLKLVQVGEFASPEERQALSRKQQSATPTECTSEVLERNSPMQIAVVEDAPEQAPQSDDDKIKKGRCSSTDDESERQSAEEQVNQQEKPRSPRPEDDEVSDPIDKLENRGNRAFSAPLSPVLPVKTRPISLTLSSANMKRVVFESSGGESDAASLKEEGRGSFGSDYASTPERHYFGQIKKCLAGIDDIMESSRKLEKRILEKQVGSKSDGVLNKSLA